MPRLGTQKTGARPALRILPHAIMADTLTMTEDALIQKMRERVADHRRTTSAANWPGNYADIAESFGPAPLDLVEDAQRRFGFPIPSFLVRLWSEVANGGIGPGYGIFGVEGGMTDDMLDLPLPDLYLAWKDQEEWIELTGRGAAERTIPICDWGCNTFSAIDCSTPDGNMLLFSEGVTRIDHGVSFARWIEDWLAGIEVGSDGYGRVNSR